MRKALRRLFIALFVGAALAAAWLVHFASTPVTLTQVPHEFTVPPGTGLKGVAHRLAADGVLLEAESFWVLGRLMGKARTIQAGTYRLEKALTPLEILDKLARGDVVFLDMLFVEGTTFRQWLAQLASHPRVRQTLAGKTEAQLRVIFGIEQPLEGWFFPDTYRFAPGTSDADILKRAHAAMKKRLAEAWAARSADTVLKSPYQALTLASIIEKETGAASERPLIASVFYNRIRRGMRLQTDPTVIYGMGERFDGNIRKKDLTADTPWNTYTRDGLPPTPIAMPGAASIKAAVNPAPADYLYFVSRGDGSHEFSRGLEEHNRAVAKYQLGK